MIAAGTLINAGTLTARDTGGGMTTDRHNITGSLSSTGTLDVEAGVTLRVNTGFLNVEGGVLNVDGVLELNNTILQFGTG